MKRNTNLLLSFLLLISFTLLLAGCNGTPSYDESLTAVDSLMYQDVDSALSRLMELEKTGFDREADRAYYCLLLTQARYRNYIKATSDSTINIALAYYKQHQGEREKFTRALIYKGAVMEELGQNESAITHYRQALEAVSDEDVFNQGYIRLRIGNLYRDNMVADSSDITLFKESLRYFKLIPDSFYIFTCLSEIGSSYIKFNEDSMRHYLHQAEEVAEQMHQPDLSQTNLLYIANDKMFSDDAEDIETAKNIALQQINQVTDDQDRNHLLMIVAFTFAKQHNTDSAIHYLNQVSDHTLLSPGQEVLYNKCLAEIAVNKGDIQQYRHHYELADHLADSIANNEMQQRLRDIEQRFDNETLKHKNEHYRSIVVCSILASLLLLSALIITLMVISRKLAKRKQQLQELEETTERMKKDQAILTEQLNSHQAMGNELKDTIKSQIEIFSRLIETHTLEYPKNPKKFSQTFKESYSINHPDKSFWTCLRTYVDSVYYNFITRTAEGYPALIDSDLKFLSLYICELPTTVIMACMGYNDVHSFYNKKRRLCSIIGINGNLEDYIKAFKPSILEGDRDGLGAGGVEVE